MYTTIRGRSHKKKRCHAGLPRSSFALSLQRLNATPTVGNLIAYQLTLRTLGPDIAQHVQVNFSFNVPSRDPTGIVSQGALGYCEPPTSNDPVSNMICRLGNLAPTRQSGVPVIIDIWVRAEQAGSLTVDADAYAPIHDTNPNDKSVADTVEVSPAQASADLSVSSTLAPDPVAAGQTLTDTIHITNTGPTEASRVFLTALLPQGVQSFNWDISGGGTDLACGRFTNSGPDYFSLCWDAIPSGHTITITVTMTAPNQPPPQLQANVLVSAWTPDPNLANNRATSTAGAN